MRILRVVLLIWIVTDGGVAAGWLAGRVVGRPEIGGIVVGTLAILLAIRIVATRGWFNPDRRRGGSIGALCGFALAAPIASMTVVSPWMAVVAMLLVGIGAIAGAGPSAAW